MCLVDPVRCQRPGDPFTLHIEGNPYPVIYGHGVSSNRSVLEEIYHLVMNRIVTSTSNQIGRA